MSTIRVGLLGWGYWGPNLARNVLATPGLTLMAVQDRDSARAAAARSALPQQVGTVVDLSALDAVVIATPASTHYRLALRALEAGCHVLVAKPLATDLEEAEELAAVAADLGRVLLVDHTFVYTGAWRKIEQLVGGGALGDVLSFDSVRINLGLFQHDVNVLWDLAPHCLSVLHTLLGQPTLVQAVGSDPLGCGLESSAYVTCWFGPGGSGPLAHLHVSWLSPVKVRRLMIGGSERMLVYDDIEPSEKVRLYDKGADLDRVSQIIGYRSGDMVAPRLDLHEALAVEMEHFAACINGAAEPKTDGASAVSVVRTLTAASLSLANGGSQVIV